MVTNLASMMVERLRVFREKNNGTLPERIIVYRDGVSEVGFFLFPDVVLQHLKRLISVLGPIQYSRCG